MLEKTHLNAPLMADWDFYNGTRNGDLSFRLGTSSPALLLPAGKKTLLEQQASNQDIAPYSEGFAAPTSPSVQSVLWLWAVAQLWVAVQPWGPAQRLWGQEGRGCLGKMRPVLPSCFVAATAARR